MGLRYLPDRIRVLLIKEAADTIFRLCQDERVRMECQAREDHYRTQLGIQQMMDRQQAVKIPAKVTQGTLYPVMLIDDLHFQVEYGLIVQEDLDIQNNPPINF